MYVLTRMRRVSWQQCRLHPKRQYKVQAARLEHKRHGEESLDTVDVVLWRRRTADDTCNIERFRTLTRTRVNSSPATLRLEYKQVGQGRL